MIYDYKCSFGHQFDINQPISEYTGDPVPCKFCEAMALRHYKAPQAMVMSDFEAAYYHSFGKVFETRKELQYHIDKNNLVHVGNDFGSGQSMQKHFDSSREYYRNKKWENFEL